MTAGLAVSGWALAAALALVMRARLERVARAEHELRGPATVIALACDRMRRSPATRRHAEALDAELARLRAGLADLGAARQGRPVRGEPERVELQRLADGALAGWRPALAADGREARIDWRAGRVSVVADRGRLAQALGNMLANAAEHGHGPLELRGRRLPGAVRVEVRNGAHTGRPQPRRPGSRGHGLGITARAARAAGGRLELAARDGEVVAALELPLEPEQARARAGGFSTDEPPAAA